MGRSGAPFFWRREASGLGSHHGRTAVGRGEGRRREGEGAILAGIDLFDARDYAAAETHFRAALAIVPDRASGLVNLAATLFHQGKFGEAIAVAGHATERDPRSPDGLITLGSALTAQGRPDDGLAAMERAVALAPDNPMALMGRASVLTELKRYDLAIADYRAVQRLDPAKVDLRGLLVVARMNACDWTGLAAETDALLAGVRAGTAHVNPFFLLAMPSTAADQLLCASATTRRDLPAAGAALPGRAIRPRSHPSRLRLRRLPPPPALLPHGRRVRASRPRCVRNHRHLVRP
ncbi:MAG: tetratricopeptide repeat protein [Bauldia sp.]